MTEPRVDFEEAARRKRRSFAGDLLGFALATKKYWLIPLLFILLVLAGIILLGQTALGPFVYAIF